MGDKPHHFILHLDSNDFISKLWSESIAESMVNLVMSLETELNDVNNSSIILRMDNPGMNENGSEKYLPY